MRVPRVYLCVLFFIFIGTKAFTQAVQPVKISQSNAHLYRDSLIQKVFGSTGFPYNIYPDNISTNISSFEYYSGFPYQSIRYPQGNLDSVDRFDISLHSDSLLFPVKEHAYIFHPHQSNGKLFIYHAGHCTASAIAEDINVNANGLEPGILIPKLLSEGYTVLAVALLHYQTTPVQGVYCGNNHDALFSNSSISNPLSYFFKPLAVSLNKLGREQFTSIYMCGLSGGGWVSSVYPAMDSSISCSIPIAGSWPMAVKQAFFPGGDMEQNYMPVFNDLLDYHDLYTLSCLAPARKMLQINNRYDVCCFSGSFQHIYYMDSVKKALLGTEGMFSFYLDETQTAHAISAHAIDVMLAFCKGRYGSLKEKPRDTVSNFEKYYFDISNNFKITGQLKKPNIHITLLKAPDWLKIDKIRGILYGTVQGNDFQSICDTVSFKVEEPGFAVLVYNYTITHRRKSFSDFLYEIVTKKSDINNPISSRTPNHLISPITDSLVILSHKTLILCAATRSFGIL